MLQLLRNLQNLLVKFQSGNTEIWIEAAEQVRSWLNDDSGIDFLEEPETESGSLQGHAEEGEEEKRTDDSDHSQPGDGDDPEGPEQDMDATTTTMMMNIVVVATAALVEVELTVHESGGGLHQAL